MESIHHATIKMTFCPEKNGKTLQQDALGEHIEEIKSTADDLLKKMELGSSKTFIRCDQSNYDDGRIPVYVSMEFYTEKLKNQALEKLSKFRSIGGEIEAPDYNLDVWFKTLKILSPSEEASFTYF